MTCDPNTIAQNAKCFCYDRTTWRAVMVYLMCQWVKKKEPVARFSYEPETAVITWNDSGGFHSGDLAAFYATPTWPSTTTIGLPLVPTVTSVSNLSSITNLNELGVEANLLTTLDVTGCTNLIKIFADNNPLTSIVGLSTCINLQTLWCFVTSLLSLDASGLVHLQDLECSDCQLGNLDITGDFALVNLEFANNPGVTIIGP